MNPVAVTFYGDVGFDRTYTHVVDFTSESQRTAYFAKVASTTVSNCAYNRFEKTLALIMDYNTACGYCYCSFPIDGRTVYAWVDSVSVINDGQNTTYTTNPLLNISLTIDPWQTYLFDFTVGESFIERQHLDRFTSRSSLYSHPYPFNPIIEEEAVNWYTVDDRDITDRMVPPPSTLINSFYDTSGNTNNTTHASFVAITVVDNDSGGADVPVYFVPVVFGNIDHTTDWRQSGTSFLFGATSDGSSLLEGTFPAMDFYYFLDGSFFTRLGFDPDSAVSAFLIPYSPFPMMTITSGGNVINVPNPSYGQFDIRSHSDSDLGMTWGYYEAYYNTKSYIPAFSSFTFYLGDSLLEFPTEDATISDFATYKCEPVCAKPPYRKVCIMGTDGRLSDCFNSPAVIDNGGLSAYKACLMVSPESCIVRCFADYDTAIPSQWVDIECQQLVIPTDAWQSYSMQRQGTDQMLTLYNGIKGVLKSVTSMGVTSYGESSGIYGAKDVLNAEANTASSLIDVADPIVNQMATESYAKAKANNIAVSGNVRALSTTLEGSVTEIPSFYLVQLTADPQTLRMANSRMFKAGYECNWFAKPNLHSRKRFNYIKAYNARIEGALNNDWKSMIQQIIAKGVTIWHGDVVGPTDIGDYTIENIEVNLM